MLHSHLRIQDIGQSCKYKPPYFQKRFKVDLKVRMLTFGFALGVGTIFFFALEQKTTTTQVSENKLDRSESIMNKSIHNNSHDSRVACEVTVSHGALFEQHPADRNKHVGNINTANIHVEGFHFSASQ